MKYDVVIVGAGPAESTAAKIVAERGFSVLVLEKDTMKRKIGIEGFDKLTGEENASISRAN